MLLLHNNVNYHVIVINTNSVISNSVKNETTRLDKN